MEDLKAALGKTGRDKITGYQGVVTAVAVYLAGDDRLQLEAPLDAEGKARHPQWFDCSRVEIA